MKGVYDNVDLSGVDPKRFKWFQYRCTGCLKTYIDCNEKCLQYDFRMVMTRREKGYRSIQSIDNSSHSVIEDATFYQPEEVVVVDAVACSYGSLFVASPIKEKIFYSDSKSKSELHFTKGEFYLKGGGKDKYILEKRYSKKDDVLVIDKMEISDWCFLRNVFSQKFDGVFVPFEFPLVAIEVNSGRPEIIDPWPIIYLMKDFINVKPFFKQFLSVGVFF